MTKFYICTKAIAKGPYRLHEIDNLNIDTNDLIWSDGYRKNRRAIQVPEFRDYFDKRKAETIITDEINRSQRLWKIVLSMLLVVLCLLIGYYFIAV